MIVLSSLKVFSFAIGFCLPTYLYFTLSLKRQREENKRLSILLHDLNNSVHDISLWIDHSGEQNEQTQVLKITVSSLRQIISNHFNPIENKATASCEFLTIGEFKNAFTFLSKRHLSDVCISMEELSKLNDEAFISLNKADSYQILMNLITNVKQAEATKLTLTLNLSEDKLLITFKNDYVQIVKQNRIGLGLESIRLMVQANNGRYLSFNTNDHWETELQLKTLENESKSKAA